MKPDDLRQQIETAQDQGIQPFFVNATIGSTVLGAFDSLFEINNILSSHKIWQHVDAAWGAAALMSDQHRKALVGIDRADSITWDLHKALRAPLLCSALLVKKGAHLKTSFDIDGSYLFHGNEEEENFHLGEKTPQCGRLGDAFKFWLIWKVRGKDYFGREVEKRFANTAQAIEMIKDRQSLWIYDDQPDFWNVCFWYAPENLRTSGGIGQCSRKDKDQLENLTVRIYECMKKDGQILVNFARIKNLPAFIRLISGHNLTREYVGNILDIIESLGHMLSSKLPELLISGGDNRLQLDHRGLNYIFIAPQPAPKNLVSRSSCSGSFISDENYKLLANLDADIRSADVSFQECMQQVHDRIREVLKIDPKTSIITVPSGTDAEYIPLLISKAHAGSDGQIVNIVTGAGEIGTHSSTAANGMYFSTVTPSGEKVRSGKKLDGIGSNVKVFTLSQRHRLTGQQNQNQDIWIKQAEKSLSDPATMVLLHIVDSTKLGRRMDVIDQVERLKARSQGRLLVTIDSCQSRTDIYRTRHYLQMGYMVMITGSKFEEGPPFSGAVIVPPQITDSLVAKNFIDFLPGIDKFITQYDISGDMDMIRPYLPAWMNWGLMLRWTCAVTNWEKFRCIENETRNTLIQNWIDGLLELIEQHSELQVFDGGEIQPGAVGDRNTIISIKLLSNGKPLALKAMKQIYHWLYEDMSYCLPDNIALTHEEKSVLRRPFLIGQPVDMGNFAVLRIALGISLVLSMEKHGIEKALADDKALALKLSLMAGHYEDIRQLCDAAAVPSAKSSSA